MDNLIIASDLPIPIFGLIAGLCMALLVLGFVFRTKFPMTFVWFITGCIFLLIFIGVDTLSMGDRTMKINGTATTDLDINLYYENDVYPIKVQDEFGEYTMQPTFIGIMLIVVSLSFIMVGVLIERD